MEPVSKEPLYGTKFLEALFQTDIWAKSSIELGLDPNPIYLKRKKLHELEAFIQVVGKL